MSNITLISYLIARGSTIELSLSGKRAIEFDGETILQVGQEHHVIAIFVGTLMKTYKNDYKFLSGTSACRWYINQNDIPEIKAFQRWYNTHTYSSNHSLIYSKILIYDMINSLPAEAIPIQKLYLRGADDTQQNFEKRTMLQLKDVDPFTERVIILFLFYYFTAYIIKYIQLNFYLQKL